VEGEKKGKLRPGGVMPELQMMSDRGEEREKK
jgi:hypothetical protein